jgi:hypothetical protein
VGRGAARGDARPTGDAQLIYDFGCTIYGCRLLMGRITFGSGEKQKKPGLTARGWQKGPGNFDWFNSKVREHSNADLNQRCSVEIFKEQSGSQPVTRGKPKCSRYLGIQTAFPEICSK